MTPKKPDARVRPPRPRQKAPINRSCDVPITGGHGKPSRAARRHANRLAKAVAAMEAQAHADNPFASKRQGTAVQENRTPPDASPEGQLIPQGDRRTQMREDRLTTGQQGTGQMSVGRPTEYTDEEAVALCTWVQAGGSLRGYSAKTGRAPATVYRWMAENAKFHALYSQAQEDRTDTLAEETLEIADESAVNPTLEGVAAAKLRIEARKWIASKLRPQKWGDKQVVEHVGAVNIHIGIPPKDGATALPMVDRMDTIDG